MKRTDSNSEPLAKVLGYQVACALEQWGVDMPFDELKGHSQAAMNVLMAGLSMREYLASTGAMRVAVTYEAKAL